MKLSFIRPNLTDNAENLKCQQDGSSLGDLGLGENPSTALAVHPEVRFSNRPFGVKRFPRNACRIAVGVLPVQRFTPFGFDIRGVPKMSPTRL